MRLLVLTVFAYLLGSVPVGYLVGYFSGVDVRKAGSGNVGATNVARIVGARQGILTFIADTAKGYIPVALARYLDVELTGIAIIGVAAFLGHLYPVFLQFKGGKGVATACGIFLSLAPLAVVVLIALFSVVAMSTRFVSLGSMVSTAAAPIVLWSFSHPAVEIVMSVFLAVTIIIRHRTNIERLLTGTEPRFEV